MYSSHRRFLSKACYAILEARTACMAVHGIHHVVRGLCGCAWLVMALVFRGQCATPQEECGDVNYVRMSRCLTVRALGPPS